MRLWAEIVLLLFLGMLLGGAMDQHFQKYKNQKTCETLLNTRELNDLILGPDEGFIWKNRRGQIIYSRRLTDNWPTFKEETP